jgi:hypothetical protein
LPEDDPHVIAGTPLHGRSLFQQCLASLDHLGSSELRLLNSAPLAK